MKYLFFDIECANCYNNCAKIFSLGYVITDEKFNILHEKEDVLINPKDRFDWYVAKKMMAYPREIFKDMPPFPDFYEGFKAMFEDPDVMVIGYAVTNDVHFLHDDCRRYGLAPYTYKFYDVQQLYARQPINNTAKNLEDSVLSWYGEEPENMHRSDEDAYNTMRIMKAIAAYHNTDLPGLMEMFPDCGGETHDGIIDYAWKKPEGEGKKKRHRSKSKKKGEAQEQETPAINNTMEQGSHNAELFVKFLEQVKPRKKLRRPPLLSGHTVTISLNYQRYHFNEMLYLVQMIVDAGGSYTLLTREADVLYTYGNEEDLRLRIFNERIEAGEEVEILPIKALFDILETGEVKLSRKPPMDLSHLEPEVTEEQSEEEQSGETAEPAPKKRRRRSRKKAAEAADSNEGENENAPATEAQDAAENEE